MMKIKQKYYILLIMSWALPALSSCKKYLDIPSSRSEVIPRSLKDLQALLYDNLNLNYSSCTWGEITADDYYLTPQGWQAAASSSSSSYVGEAYAYIWDTDPLSPVVNSSYQWVGPYVAVLPLANMVLDILPDIPRGADNMQAWDNVKGNALFYRAFQFHSLAQAFCRPYSATASVDPGIVLKLSSGISEKYTRATVQETYDQIISDLKLAAGLLPAKTANISLPNRAAAYAALARTYLCMRNYEQAGFYAGLSLQQYSTLLDYNSLIPLGTPPVPAFNIEVMFFNSSRTGSLYRSDGAIADTVLTRSYAANDLRKAVFFRDEGGAYRWRGSYAANLQDRVVFDGFATDETYLIRAECFARAGKITEAMDDLNALMVKRWKAGAFVPFTAATADAALALILAERRKELCFRNQRWSDLRRFNLEGSNVTLKRIISGKEYTLPPNDPRWVMLIPLEEINRSGIEQNRR